MTSCPRSSCEQSGSRRGSRALLRRRRLGIPHILLLGSVCGFCLGCSVLHELHRTLSSTAKQDRQQAQMKRRNREAAEVAWDRYCEVHPGEPVAEEFQQGFCDGVVYYLESGLVQPPPNPPQGFWSTRYQTPQGQALIEQWYAGFQTGANGAAENGWREPIPVPTTAPFPFASDYPHIISYDEGAVLEPSGFQWPEPVEPIQQLPPPDTVLPGDLPIDGRSLTPSQPETEDQ